MARIIRDYRPEDEPALRALYDRRTDGAPFPDLSSPLYVAKKVVEVDGEITNIAYLRKTATTHMYLGATPCKEEESAIMHGLQTELLSDAWMAGFQEIYMQVAGGPVENHFCDRLQAFGWTQTPGEPLYEHVTGDIKSLKVVM